MKDTFIFVLDTLQIYFPWDDDLYTYLKNRGFASKEGYKALPLIYTDDCESTTSVPEVKRNYIIPPEKFNRTLEELNWKIRSYEGRERYVIPAEKIRLKASLTHDQKIRFDVIPSFEGKEQYHLEYSVMSAYGKLYSNWSNFYFKKNEFEAFIKMLEEGKIEPDPTSKTILQEAKQNQREELDYVPIEIDEYCFNIGDFSFARDYLVNAGYNSKIPSLWYSSKDASHKKLMDPTIKFGVIFTRDTQGFWERHPQFVMKISQPKTVTIGNRKKKVKGIITEAINGNYFIISARELLAAYNTIIKQNRSIQSKLI